MIDDEQLARRVAYIVGGWSAAQAALDELDRRYRAGEQARIWLDGNTWIVGPGIITDTQGRTPDAQTESSKPERC